MPSIYESLSSELSHNYLGQVANQLGTDEQKASQAIGAALPELLGRLAKNARRPEGAEALAKALERDHDGSILDNLGEYLRQPDQQAGDGILRHVLGSKRAGVEQRLGQRLGLNAGSTAKLLAMLAPLLLGALGRAKQSGKLDPGGLGRMLKRESGGNLGCLMKLLPMVMGGKRALLLCAVLVVQACGGNAEAPAEEPSPAAKSPSESPSESPTEAPSTPAVVALDKLIAEVAARPEKNVSTIQVRHILVGFEGAGRGVQRSLADAKTKAAELLARIRAGEDFAKLMREHSDDPGAGTYTMTDTNRSQKVYGSARTGMVRAFGDVGWRLAPREVGVAGYDKETSPFGFHVIERVQ